MENRSINIIGSALLFVCMFAAAAAAGSGSGSGTGEDTMLMFVGEDLDVLTIATRQAESARQAPAVARVITREEILDSGYKTLAQALSAVPGFHMEQKEWGSMPFMRGIANSILFLYDTVPIGSTVSKSLNFLDREISLERVKRIEIIRGPGSVLWGPDAYAAIVNIVPLSARDLEGGEAGLGYGGPGDLWEAHAQAGHDSGKWNAFLSVNGADAREDDTVCNLVRFWGDGQTPTPPDRRLGARTPERSGYAEAYANVGYDDWLTVSGRASGYDKAYAMQGTDSPYSWYEARQLSTGHVKLEAGRRLGMRAGLRFNAWYEWLNPDHTIIDRDVGSRENIVHGELIADYSFFSGKGLLTGGLSYRDIHVRNAPTWDGYLLDFLDPENELYVPILIQHDYDMQLGSAFGQYTHTFSRFDVLASVRFDDHSDYEDAVSYNAGVVWHPLAAWTLKVLYGTAYRTPYPSQLSLSGPLASPEKIGNFSLRVIWQPVSRFEIALTGYNSRIENHVMEDPYAGLSQPNEQEINGIEAEVRYSPVATVELTAGFSILENKGPDEAFLYNDYSYIDEDGNLVRHYITINYPYDTGPERLFNFTAKWRPFAATTLFARVRYIDERRMIHPLGAVAATSPDVWLLDLNCRQQNVLLTGLDLSASLINATDAQYQTPGTYANIPGQELTFLISLKYSF